MKKKNVHPNWTIQARQNGFTLIELLVVSTITVLLLLSVSSMLMTFLLSNAKTNISRQIKAEGNEMISQLEFVLRDAQGLDSSVTCNAAGYQNSLSTVTIEDLDTSTAVDTLSFVSVSATDKYIALNGKRLNSTFVISGIPTLTCTQDTSTKKTSVRIKFTLSRTGDSSMKEDFESLIQLRNS